MPAARHDITLLFLDIPTALHVRDLQGNDAAARFLAEVIAVLDRVRREHGGQEVRSVGNALLSRYPDPPKALAAACQMHAVTDGSRVSAMQPRLRAGVHCGEVTVHGRSVYGEAVSIAARLVSVCAPGQTLTTTAVYDTLLGLERHCLRPVPPPANWAASLGAVYEVVGGGPLGGPAPDVVVSDSARCANTRTLAPLAADASGRSPAPGRGTRGPTPAEASQAPGRGHRLCLLHGPGTELMDRKRATLALGREAGNDIVVSSGTASRRHAQVEWRPGGFYLVDYSWNGTYIYDAAGHESHVHNAEFRLQGSGWLSLGCPAGHAEADVVGFVEAR